MEKFDAIVIGGGVAGATVGSLLAKNGKKVVLLESRARIGGRATTYEHEGIKTDYGQHLGTAGGNIEKVLKIVGSNLSFIYPDPFFYIYHDEKIIPVPNNLKDYHKFEYIPCEKRAELVELLEYIVQIPLESDEFDSISLKDWLIEKTSSQSIMGFLFILSSICYTQDNPAEVSAGPLLRWVGQILKKGGPWAFYPAEGGFNAFNVAFAEAIIKCGGKVRTNTTVREILVRNNRVVGVTAEGPEGLLNFEAPTVISNVPIMNIFKLISTEYFPRWFVERIRFLESVYYEWTGASLGITFIATKPLHNLKSNIVVPADSGDNRAGPSYLKWVFQPTGITPNIAPPGKHYFGYGSAFSRSYADLLREVPQIFEKDLKLFEEELWRLFPDFDRSSIIRKGSGLLRLLDLTMQFPGNSWKQRLDVKAPSVDGLYFAGDMIKGMGCGTDLCAHTGILCAERILKTKLV